jgi:hypothetical protein
MPVSHSRLVQLARNWLWALEPSAERTRVALVATEVSSVHAHEQPDVFAVGNDGQTYLIEVKVSRADFLNDRKKPHRANEVLLGNWRWYCAPSGIIEPHEIPPQWGLIQIVNGKLVERFPARICTNVDHEAEKAILISIMRNVWHGPRVRGVGLRAYSHIRAQERWVWDTPLAAALDPSYPKFKASVGIERREANSNQSPEGGDGETHGPLPVSQ